MTQPKDYPAQELWGLVCAALGMNAGDERLSDLCLTADRGIAFDYQPVRTEPVRRFLLTRALRLTEVPADTGEVDLAVDTTLSATLELAVRAEAMRLEPRQQALGASSMAGRILADTIAQALARYQQASTAAQDGQSFDTAGLPVETWHWRQAAEYLAAMLAPHVPEVAAHPVDALFSADGLVLAANSVTMQVLEYDIVKWCAGETSERRNRYDYVETVITSPRLPFYIILIPDPHSGRGYYVRCEHRMGRDPHGQSDAKASAQDQLAPQGIARSGPGH